MRKFLVVDVRSGLHHGADDLHSMAEVVTEGKVYRVKGDALQLWIVRRQSWNGPRGYMFTKRPGL